MPIPFRQTAPRSLERLINPRTIAVVGASPRQGSFGERVLHNLGGFQGTVFAVNPKYESVGAHRCHPSLASLPEVPDCAVLVGNRDTVEQSVRDCAAVGVGSAIVFASGFAETGLAERVEQQARLVALARETGVRVLGPNCMGIVNCTTGASMTFQSTIPPAPSMARSIGLVSQSGALGLGLAQASERGVSFSHVLTCGNSCDLDVADFVDYLVDSPSCDVIACIFEGMADPLRLVQAAQRAWAADKPLIVFKLATGEQGTAAAASHTGSLAGSHAVYRAALEQVGAIVLDNYNALIETAAFFAKAGMPPLGGAGAGVLATSGGAAIAAADEAEACGVALPQPSAATRDTLLQYVPEFGSVANPCDVTAQVLSNPIALDACADAMLADANYAALVVPHTLSYEFGLARIVTFDEVARRHDKIVCNVWMSERLGGPGTRETETSPSVALFRSMRGCFAALAAWQARAARRLAQGAVPAHDRAGEADASKAWHPSSPPSHALPEREAKEVLARYGIPVTREVLATTPQAACAAARSIGYPVVVKAESADLPHKTEAGVVRLDLSSDAAVEKACAEIMANARAHAPEARIDGFLVQEMVPRGLEIVVGGKIDPMFGPLVVVGFGGIFVELLKDTAMALAPIDADEAMRLLGSLQHADLLDGFRGIPAVDRTALSEIVAAASRFLSEQQSWVAELDINPLICHGSRITAVDALIIPQRPEADAASTNH